MIKATTIAINLLPFLATSAAAAQTGSLDQLPQVTELLQRHKTLLRETEESVEPGRPTTKEAHATRAPQTKESGLSHARDPFALTTLILQGGGAYQGGDGAAARLPVLRLRGLAHHSGQAGLALIEVEGSGIYMLRVGEIVTLRSDQTPLTLRLKRIHPSSIEIEAGSSQQVVVVR